MKVEVLYFKGCPNLHQVVDNVLTAVREQGIMISLGQIEVHTPEEAKEMAFLGSPSVRVNGLDVEPGAREADGFGLGCRTYVTLEGRSGTPSVATIRRALAEATD